MNNNLIFVLIGLVTNIFEFYILNVFLNHYFGYERCPLRRSLYAIIFVVTMQVVNYFQIPIANTVTTLLLAFFYVLFFYNNKLHKKIAFAIIYVAMSAVAEMLFTFVISIFSSIPVTITISGSWTYLITGMVGKAILYALVRYMIHKYPHNFPQERDYNILILAMFPVTAVIAMFVILNFDNMLNLSKFNHILVILLLVCYLYLSVIIFFIYHSALYKSELESQIKLNHEMSAISQQLFAQQINEVETLKSLQHEFKRNLSIISDYISKGKYEDLSAYCEQLSLHMDDKKIAHPLDFKNFALSSLYGRLLHQCQQNEIELETDIRFLNFDFLNQIDANTIFGNLFDNAIQACVAVPSGRRWIKLVFFQVNGHIILKVSNSKINRVVVSQEGHAMSTRRNYEEEGYGLENILRAAERYNGYMTYEHDNEWFCCTVRLNRPQNAM